MYNKQEKRHIIWSMELIYYCFQFILNSEMCSKFMWLLLFVVVVFLIQCQEKRWVITNMLILYAEGVIVISVRLRTSLNLEVKTKHKFSVQKKKLENRLYTLKCLKCILIAVLLRILDTNCIQLPINHDPCMRSKGHIDFILFFQWLLVNSSMETAAAINMKFGRNRCTWPTLHKPVVLW